MFFTFVGEATTKSLKSISDPCIYVDAGGDTIFIGVDVDDIILVGQNLERIKNVKESLSREFNIKDMGKLHYTVVYGILHCLPYSFIVLCSTHALEFISCMCSIRIVHVT